MRRRCLDLSRARPGQIVYSPLVSHVLFGDTESPADWPDTSVWGLFRDLLPEVGLQAGLIPPVAELARQAAAQAYAGPWPYLSVPEANWPQIEPARAAARFRPDFRRIAGAHSLSRPLRMGCATLVCARLVGVTREALDPRIGVRLALEVVLGSAKMRPLVRGDEPMDPARFGGEVVVFE